METNTTWISDLKEHTILLEKIDLSSMKVLLVNTLQWLQKIV